jgi:hypothetical protein
MPLQLTAPTASQALARAQARGVLPLSLSTAQARDQLSRDIRRNSVFSARTTNAIYLHAVKQRVERLIQGGANNDLGQIRLELKQELQRLGYTPQKGFPGDEALGIPPAEPGSLRDLSSDRRLNLMLDTQRKLMAGAAQKARGEEGSRARQFPYWELIRIIPRKVERGTPESHSKGWKERFEEVGGHVVKDAQGRRRMLARKGSRVWYALGDSKRFGDALDTDHPPFAFESGIGWGEVHWREAQELLPDDKPEEPQDGKVTKPDSGSSSDSDAFDDELTEVIPKPPADKGEIIPPRPGEDIIPPPKISTSGLGADTIAALKQKLSGLREKNGVLTLDRILGDGGNALTPPRIEAPAPIVLDDLVEVIPASPRVMGEPIPPRPSIDDTVEVIPARPRTVGEAIPPRPEGKDKKKKKKGDKR